MEKKGKSVTRKLITQVTVNGKLVAGGSSLLTINMLLSLITWKIICIDQAARV